MTQLLLDQGWVKYYECMCGGSQRQHWTNSLYPGYEVRIRPTKNTFSILHRNMIVAGPYWGYQLESKLKEHGIYR